MSPPLVNWFKYSSPATFYPLAGRMIPFFAVLALAFFVAGAWVGFFVAPTDAQQGEGYRIIFLHVPTSWMSMFIYLVMAFWSAMGLVFNTRLSSMMAAALAPTGAMFAALSLITGSLWGKPMWGTWWVWDARLTSVLVLFFLYLGHVVLVRSFDDPERGYRSGAILALVGVVNLPIIKFSVDWWNTLHQPATISLTGAPRMYLGMLWPLLLAALGYTLVFAAIVLARTRAAVMERRIRAVLIARAAETAR